MQGKGAKNRTLPAHQETATTLHIVKCDGCAPLPVSTEIPRCCFSINKIIDKKTLYYAISDFLADGD